MPLTKQEIATVDLLKNYCAKDDEEIARLIAIDRRLARELERSVSTVESLLQDQSPAEHDRAEQTQLLRAEIDRLSEALEDATRLNAELKQRLEEDTVEGKSLSSHQRLVLGLTRKKNSEEFLAVATIVDQIAKAGYPLDEKTVRKIIRAAQDRFESGASLASEIPD